MEETKKFKTKCRGNKNEINLVSNYCFCFGGMGPLSWWFVVSFSSPSDISLLVLVFSFQKASSPPARVDGHPGKKLV